MSQKPSAAKTQWQPTIPIDQSIYEGLTTQQAPLGTRLEVGDRVFYYGQAAASVAAGNVLCAPVIVASHQADILTPAATVAGAKTITVTMGTAVTVNAYAEGSLVVSSGTGNGVAYRIRSNSAALTAGNLTVTLYDDIIAPMTATNELNLIPNPYAGVNVGSEALGMPVGVAPCNITSGGYGWLQTFGPSGPLNVAATPAAGVVRLGTTGGVVAAFDATTNGGLAGLALVIGKNYNLAGTAGENTPIFLSIRP